MDALIAILAIGLGVAFLVWIARGSDRANASREELRRTASPDPYAPRLSTIALGRRAAGIEFLLTEMRSDAWMAMPAAQRIELIDRYEQELAQIQAALAAPLAAAPRGPAIAQPKPPPVTPQPLPRKQMDWSWLAEQQASLFLFAGAFLVVVAALIYVGYSGQALTGALKVTLLAAYTVAFLTAGIVCLRIPVVRMAGLVFIGISAILLPLNFVLAASVLESDISDEGMWLLGSLASAAFYAGVGGLGLGRQYAFAAGAALASAAGASAFLLDFGVEWAPVPFLGLAALIAVVEVGVPQAFRKNVVNLWVWQAHAITAAALAVAVLTAIAVTEDNEDVSTRWFGAVAAGLGLAFYTVQALRGNRFAVTGGVVALVGLTSAVVFGLDISPEYYAFSLIGAGLLVAAAAPSSWQEPG